MGWPTKLGEIADNVDVVEALSADGVPKGAAYQAATVAKNDEAGARQYLEMYVAPNGEQRESYSMMAERGQITSIDESSFLGDRGAAHSGPGGPYDYDRLVDPAQLVDLDGTSIRDVALKAIADAGAENDTEKVCALYDHVKLNVTYQYNTEQWGTGNYWASAAETLVHGHGDCSCQAILLGALAQGAGFATRHVCIPGHAFCQVLVPDFDADSVTQWYTTGKSSWKTMKTLSTGVNYWVVPTGEGEMLKWMFADLTMCTYAGARGSNVAPKGTSGTGVLETDGGWDYPAEWKACNAGASVTYRYATDQGTHFEWLCESGVDGGSPDGMNERCFGSSTKGVEDNGMIGIYCEAFQKFVEYDADDSGTITSDEMVAILESSGLSAEDMPGGAVTFPEFCEWYVGQRKTQEGIGVLEPSQTAGLAAMYSSDQQKFYYFRGDNISTQSYPADGDSAIGNDVDMHGSPWNFPEGIQVDAATFRDGKYVFFCGDQVIEKLPGMVLGAPKSISSWGVPGGLDAVCHCSHSDTTYFFKSYPGETTQYWQKKGNGATAGPYDINGNTFSLPAEIQMCDAVYVDDDEMYYFFEKEQFYTKARGYRTQEEPRPVSEWGAGDLTWE
eukprot:gb/GFBE01054307.1/.p1 GENE.gb/GFBE01054307.1/~~gb/GFBE01054307.1/.p1  ORF type:complete len:615 (+),score=124.73 gb/GFBE01054307.1/:1-1845(+)